MLWGPMGRKVRLMGESGQKLIVNIEIIVFYLLRCVECGEHHLATIRPKDVCNCAVCYNLLGA